MTSERGMIEVRERHCAEENTGRTLRRLDWAMLNEKDSGALTNMHVGDVLVSHPSAVREHDISIVPSKPHAKAATHRDAIEHAAVEAQALAVDGWVTEDQIHVVKFAAHRPDGE